MNGLTAVLTTPAGLFVSIGLIGLSVTGLMYLAAGFWLRRLTAPAGFRQRYRSAGPPRRQLQRRSRPRLSQQLTTVRLAGSHPAGEVRWTLPRQPKA